MMIRATSIALLLFTASISTVFADDAQAKRIAGAHYQYCIQESLGNTAYCSCVSDVYEENLIDISLSKKQEAFMIQGLSGQLSFDALGVEELKLSEEITKKLDNAAFEEGFASCFSLIEEDLAEYEISADESLTDDQRRAIKELEAIEELEDEEEEEEEEN